MWGVCRAATGTQGGGWLVWDADVQERGYSGNRIPTSFALIDIKGVTPNLH